MPETEGAPAMISNISRIAGGPTCGTGGGGEGRLQKFGQSKKTADHRKDGQHNQWNVDARAGLLLYLLAGLAKKGDEYHPERVERRKERAEQTARPQPRAPLR